MTAAPLPLAIHYNHEGLSHNTLLHLHRQLVLPRTIEEKMLILLRQGRVSKWFSGIGQEAISVGTVCALNPTDWLMPLHRNLGLFTGRNMPLARLFAQLQGKASGFSKGRERSFHFGSIEHHICGMISHLGPQLAVACGAALAAKLDGKPEVSVAFTGDGGTSEGDFHEALNVAAVWQLPVIFIIENNGYGLSTPTNEQYHCQTLADRAIGYGMESQIIDGNNVVEVYQTVQRWAEDMRQNPRPVLLEMRTFRMRGHEEASGTKYVPKELMHEWAAKDPLTNFENYLLAEGILTEQNCQAVYDDAKAQIEEAIEIAFPEAEPVYNLAEQLADLYAPAPQSVSIGHPSPTGGPTTELRLVDAIQDGLRTAMRRHADLVLMGQDIGAYGGVFKVTEGFVDEFGPERVRNTPLCESAILGTALGLSLKGKRAMMEMQFADFVTVGFNQIVNNLAKIHWRWGVPARVVVRMPTGAGVGAGPFHSQSNEAWFFHTPGLKVVYPSNPIDAKGLLLAAFEDNNPILFFEHKALYRAITAPVPTDFYLTPIGKAAIARPGTDATIITYGAAVHWALEAAESVKEQANVEVIDLRTLLPWDKDTVAESARRTGKVLVLHEDTLTGGIGGEIAAWLGEHCFESLDAPIMREASHDLPVPFAPSLEKDYLPKTRALTKLRELLAY